MMTDPAARNRATPVSENSAHCNTKITSCLSHCYFLSTRYIFYRSKNTTFHPTLLLRICEDSGSNLRLSRLSFSYFSSIHPDKCRSSTLKQTTTPFASFPIQHSHITLHLRLHQTSAPIG
jgi:hypothetical protein